MPAKSKAPLSRWTKRLKSLRALSLRQPWAWLVANGYKDIENRSWRTNHRGRAASYSRQLESHGVFGEKTLGGSERTHDVLLIAFLSR
jgi:hypothetical protein